MSKYPEKCHVAGCPCHEWSAKSPSETYYGHPRLDTGQDKFLVPEAKNVLEGDSAQATAISAPAFEQEWQDAPHWTRNYVEQGKLRAVLFDVIDAGCTCESGEQHPWELDDDPNDPEQTEDIVNAQRVRFVDEVMKRLQPNTQTANYWFIRGQHAKEVELLAGMNVDLKEMIRVARERIRR